MTYLIDLHLDLKKLKCLRYMEDFANQVIVNKLK